MFPMFDPMYIVFGCAMLGMWHLAITRDRIVWSIATGVCVFVTTFFTYTPLVLGAFMLADAVLLTRGSLRHRLLRLTKHGALAVVACVIAYLVLWLVTGYDPIATFHQSLANHHWQL